MNGLEIIRNKNRRKTEQRKVPKIDLNFSQINSSKLKLSISARREIKNNNKNNPINSIYNHKSQQLLNSILQKDLNVQLPGLKRNYFIWGKCIESENY